MAAGPGGGAGAGGGVSASGARTALHFAGHDMERYLHMGGSGLSPGQQATPLRIGRDQHPLLSGPGPWGSFAARGVGAGAGGMAGAAGEGGGSGGVAAGRGQGGVRHGLMDVGAALHGAWGCGGGTDGRRRGGTGVGQGGLGEGGGTGREGELWCVG